MQEIKKGWNKVKLGNISNIGDGAHTSLKRINEGILYLTSKNFKKDGLNLDKIEYISNIDYEKHFKKDGKAITRPKCDDLLLSIIGSIGAPYIIKKGDLFGLSSSVSIIRPNHNLVSSKYIYYYIKSDLFQDNIQQIKSGVAQSFLSLGMIRNLEIVYPSNKIVQQKITSVFSKYDDLIENNNKRIKVLEETTQSIYEEWFVNYNFPGSEGIKMVDSGNDDFGMIPEGWNIGKIKDFGNIITGKTPSKKKEENYGNYMGFVKTPDLHGNLFNIQTNESLSEIGVNTQKNKIIPKNSIVISCIGTIGAISITSKDSQTNQQINSIVLNNENNLEYLYFVLKGTKEYLEKLGASGATLLNINKEKFSNVNVLYPNQKIVDSYSKIIKENFKEILNLQKQNQNLKETRDLLIPMLVSGEMDVENLDVK